MDWFAVHFTQLNVPPLSLVPPAPLGAWLRLHGLAYCSYQSDLIPDCEGWADSAWMRTCGLSRADVEEAIRHGLAEWRDGGLLVALFDQKGMDLYRVKSSGGKRGAAIKWERWRAKRALESQAKGVAIGVPQGEVIAISKHNITDQSKAEQSTAAKKPSPSPFMGRGQEETERKPASVEEELRIAFAKAEALRLEREA